MRKNYILDTSVLINDPNSFKNFSGNDVIIPINVIDELDKLKTFANETGKNARVCIRQLDAICKNGDISKGIKLENNVILKIDTSVVSSNKFGPTSYVDNKILACAFNLIEKNKKKKVQPKVILVSQDINLRLRAQSFKIAAEEYIGNETQTTDLYQGFQPIVSNEIGKALLKKEFVEIANYPLLTNILPHECIHFESESGDGIALGRRIGDRVTLVKNKKPWGLEPRNKEQAFAIDMLCDYKLPLVTLIGRAGGGKTICTVASALEMVLEQKRYNKLIVYRPIQAVGKDLGYLPGSLEEKLNPWMEAIFDSLEVLFESKNGSRWKMMLDRYFDDGSIQMDAITYIRGRSIPNALIVIDEAQNTSKDEIKTILTRAGMGSKIILTGDITQIDNPNLDIINNGLTYVVEKFKTLDIAGHMTFSKGERSLLATLASEIL